MARGGHGLPKVSPGPAMPTLLRPADGPPLKWPYGCFSGGPFTASSTSLDTVRLCCTPRHTSDLEIHQNSGDEILRQTQGEYSARHFCEICGRGFDFPHRLLGHLELVHKRFDDGDKTHSCTICNREFKFARLLENHMQSQHSDILYCCIGEFHDRADNTCIDRNFPCQTLKFRKVSLVVMGS
jgi:hypothetical protein